MKRTLAIALLLAGCDRWNPDGQAAYPNNEQGQVTYYVNDTDNRIMPDTVEWVPRGMYSCAKGATCWQRQCVGVRVKGSKTRSACDAGERKFGGGIPK